MKSGSEKKPPNPDGVNLMDLIELIVLSTLFIFLAWKNVSEEKVSPVEIVICLYLAWELYKKVPKFFYQNRR